MDSAQERLVLFERTVRERTDLAHRVESLKLPYMTRENAKADLTRVVHSLKQLKYIDLPHGAFCDSQASMMLRLELQCCNNLRWARFTAGGELSFLTVGQIWPKIEHLQLRGLSTDVHRLVQVLLNLPLNELQISDMSQFGDEAFSPSLHFPPLQTLALRDLPSLTSNGLTAYVSRPSVGHSITDLKLSRTGVRISDLHIVLGLCHSLSKLYVCEDVERPFSVTQIPLLASSSLRTLSFEMNTLAQRPANWTSPSESYYSYIARSVLAGSLPSLKHLYALSPTLPNLLRNPRNNTEQSNTQDRNPFQLSIHQTLFVYTKKIADLEWDVTVFEPKMDSDRHPTRPVSLLNPPTLSPYWQNNNRKSVIVSNGFGGFLTIPEGPPTPGRLPLREERDAWMG